MGSVITESTAESVAVRNDLEQALANREFYLMYQPVLSLREARVVGVEALLRWNHPRWGDLSPRVFVAAAESIGLTFSLTRTVLQTLCQQGADWIVEGLPSLMLSANISPAQLSSIALPSLVGRVLDETGFPAGQLAIEVEESSLSRDRAEMRPVLTQLADQGVGIFIDDFGVHDASLSVLDMPGVQGVKLGDALFGDTDQGPHHDALVHGVQAYGEAQDLSVVAKGVETDQQLLKVHEYGVNLVQGYRISRPLTSDALAAWLHESKHRIQG